jgi:hypothetical protein
MRLSRDFERERGAHTVAVDSNLRTKFNCVEDSDEVEEADLYSFLKFFRPFSDWMQCKVACLRFCVLVLMQPSRDATWNK